MRVIFNVSPLE
jgi:hypothetical protein